MLALLPLNLMNKILKEPLLHFIFLGALIYLASILLGDNTAQQQQIIVTEGKIRHLATLYEKTWQRRPTKAELENVVQEYVLEQAAYYEGVNLGLDKNDIVIIRRVHQKLDFLAEEYTSRPEATDERLSDYWQDNAEKFRLEPKLSIRQIYLDPEKQGDAINLKVQNLLTELTAQPEQNITHLGDRYLFKPFYKRQSLNELERLLGRDFAQISANLTVGKWHGPIRSSFGVHLVYVEEKQNGILPELAQIRSKVLREWENSLRQRSIKEYYQALLKRYPVTIHWPINGTLAAVKQQ